MRTYDSFLQELLQDPEFFEEYYKDHYIDEIGMQLIELRSLRGMTQTQLAEKANTTQTVVSRLENGSTKPSLETVRKLANALDAVIEITLTPKEELKSENSVASLIKIPELREDTNRVTEEITRKIVDEKLKEINEISSLLKSMQNLQLVF